MPQKQSLLIAISSLLLVIASGSLPVASQPIIVQKGAKLAQSAFDNSSLALPDSEPIFLLSPLMPFGAISSSLAEEPPLSYPPFTKECTETEVRQYAQDFANSKFARLALTACGSKAVPYLISFLKSEETQSAAVDALGDIGKEAQAAIPDLIELLDVNHDAKFTLAEIGETAVPALSKALKDKSKNVRQNAAIALSRIGKKAKAAVPNLIEALKDSDGQVRSYAAEALAEIGKEARAAVPLLIALLKKDGTSDVRRNAAAALGKIGEEPQEAVPVLIEALQEDDNVNDDATWALGRFGKAAVPSLIEALKDENEELRSRAVFALVLIGKDKDAEAAVPALEVALKDKNPIIRARAAVALAEINPANARSVVSDLVAALKYSGYSEDGETQVRAAKILGNLGQNAQKAVPTLSNILKRDCRYADPYQIEVCVNTVIALGNIGQVAEAAVPDLIDVLKQERRPWNTELRANTALALGKIGADTSETVAALVAALGDGSQEVRSSAAIALEKIGVNLKDLIPRLIANLNAQDENIRRQAALALGTIGQDAVPALIEALNHKNLLTSKGAAFALGYIQLPTKEVIEQLEEIVRDESNDLDLRRVAASSLEKLGQDMQLFFEQYDLVSPSNAVCPPIYFSPNYAFFEFDAYTGKCIYFYQTYMMASGGSLIDAIREIFGGKKNIW